MTAHNPYMVIVVNHTTGVATVKGTYASKSSATRGAKRIVAAQGKTDVTDSMIFEEREYGLYSELAATHSTQMVHLHTR